MINFKVALIQAYVQARGVRIVMNFAKVVWNCFQLGQ